MVGRLTSGTQVLRWRWAAVGLAVLVPVPRAQYLFELFKKKSKGLKLIQSKDSLSMLNNFQIKYRFESFEIRNNVPYRNFFKFEVYFELKFREAPWIEFR
jgi:hypothetical protein